LKALLLKTIFQLGLTLALHVKTTLDAESEADAAPDTSSIEANSSKYADPEGHRQD
jgi:hypothetical protein